MEETARLVFGLGCQIEEPERLGFGVRKIQQEDDCVGRTRRPLMNTTVSEKQTVSESDGEDDGALVQM